MTGDNIKKVVDIKVNYESAVRQLANYREVLLQTEEAEKKLKKARKDGDNSPELVQQLVALQQNAKATKDAMRLVEKSLQNTMKVERENVQSLSGLRAELSKATQAYDRLGATQRNGEYGKALKNQINTITTSIKSAEEATQRFYRNVGNYKSAVEGLKQIGDGFGKLKNIILSVTGTLSAGAFGKSVMETARGFEDAMARVRSVSNPTQGDFESLTDKARELGRSTKYTAEEVGNAMEDLSRKGFKAGETLNSINPVLRLAQANVVDMTDAAQVASSTLRAFGKDTSEMAHVADVLSAGCANSATNLTQLGEAMKVAGPTARVAKVSLEETVSLIGSLANVGMTGSDAGTGVKQVLMALSTAATGGKKAQAALKAYNLEINETRIRNGELLDILKEMKKSGIANSLDALKQISGKYASPRLANIIKSVDDIEKLKNTLETSMGTNDEMFEESLGKTTKSLMTLKSAWQDFNISISTQTEDYVIGAMDKLTDLLHFLSDNIAFIARQVGTLLIGIAGHKAWGLIQTSIASMFKFAEAYREKEIAGYAEAKARQMALEQSVAVAKAEVETRKLAYATAESEAEIAQEQLKHAEIRLEEAQTTVLTQEEIAKRETAYFEASENAILAEKRVATARAELNASMMSRSGSERRLAEETKNVTLLGSAVSTTKGIVKGAFAMLKSALKSIIPLLVIGTVIELIQGISHFIELTTSAAHAVEDIERDVNDAITEGSANENKRLATIRAMGAQYKEIYEQQLNTHKLNNAQLQQVRAMCSQLGIQKDAVDDLNKNLYITKDVNDQITKAIETQTQRIMEQAKQKAYTDLATSTYTQMLKLGMAAGIASNDPTEIAKQYHEKVGKDAGIASAIGAFFGMDTDFAKAKMMDTYFERWKYLAKWMPTEGEARPETPEGDPKKVDYSKTKKDKSHDYIAQMQKTITALQNIKGKNQEALAPDDAETKKQKVIDTNWKALEAIGDQIGLKRFRQYFSIESVTEAKTDEERKIAYQELAKKFGETLKNENGSIDKAIKFVSANNKEMYDAFLKLLPEAINSTVASIATQTVRIDKEAEIKALSDKIALREKQHAYTNEARDFERYINEQKQINRVKTKKSNDEMTLNYQKGNYGATYADKHNVNGDYITDSDRLEVYKQYEEKRKELEEKYAKDKNDKYFDELKQLNDVYQAEAYYYDSRLQAERDFSLESLKLEEERWEKRGQMRQLALAQEAKELELASVKALNERTGYYQKEYRGSKEYWAKVEDDLGVHETAKLRIQAQQARAEVESIEATGQKVGESYEEYQGRLLDAKIKEEQVFTEVNDSILNSDQARLEAVESFIGSTISLMGALGEENEELARAEKIITLAKIAFCTGEAIAKTVAEASSKGWPACIPIIIGGIATVVTNMASAISTVNSAKFATGGHVYGAGTGTSDSVPAQLSAGEFVMTAKATKLFEPLMMAMNAIGDGVQIPQNNYISARQTGGMADSIATAISEMRPQVDVREITRAQNRVKTITNLESV